MRVLHLGAGNLYGAIERHLVALARCRDACPSATPIFGVCFEDRLASELRAQGAAVEMFGAVRLSRPWTVAAARRRARQSLAESRPDAVVCHSCGPHALFAPVVRSAGLPLAFYAHDVPGGRGWLERWAQRTAPDLVLANSRYTATAVAKFFPTIPVQTHYGPVAPPAPKGTREERSQVRFDLGVSADCTVIIATSRMEPWKGHRLLLAALARLRNERAHAEWQCWIVGGAQRPKEAEYFAELQEIAQQRGLAGRVTFLGQRNDVATLLNAADIHCQPNESPPPFGIAFVEALWAGLPVVTVGIGGAAEIVDDSCGVLVPPANPRTLADALHGLIDDPAKRARLGAAGPARAAALCDPAQVIPEFYGGLSQIIGSAPSALPVSVSGPRPIGKTIAPTSPRSDSAAGATGTAPAAQKKSPPGIVNLAAPTPPRSIRSASIVLAFIILQFACQIALLVPSLGPLRVLIRIASLGGSLALLLVLKGKPRYHPAWTAALCVMALMLLELFHPTGNTLLARLASIALYLAILAPIYWIGRARLTTKDFRTIIIVFWAFHSLSSLAGAAQVYFPQLQPPVSLVIQGRGADYVESLKIELPDGRSVFRPMGLTDQPGGAAMAGMYTVLFGLGIFLIERRWAFRAACLATMAVGLFVLYLSQVRSVLVMTGICVLVFCLMLALRRDFKRLATTLFLLVALVGMSFGWAVWIGGDVVTDRLATLIDQPASKVYYNSRGHFLSDTIYDLLPRYPMGAGLGRWGMMNQYFGDNTDVNSAPIWVEIQWTAWVLDGGAPLVLAYVAALLLALWVAWRIARKNGGLGGQDGGLWGSLLVAYNLAALAVTFNCPLFIGQGGLEFWLLNCCLFAAYGWQTSQQPAGSPWQKSRATTRWGFGLGSRRRDAAVLHQIRASLDNEEPSPKPQAAAARLSPRAAEATIPSPPTIGARRIGTYQGVVA